MSAQRARWEDAAQSGTGEWATFIVKMRVRLDTETGFTFARWNAKRGTGNYANLHGSGLEGSPTVPGAIEDFYVGKLKG